MKRLLLLTILTGTLLTVAVPALAHPLGNFTTNLHLGIHIDEDRLDVRLIVDMAEIPTFREPLDADDDGTMSDDELDSYAAASCTEHRQTLAIESDATPIALTASTSTASLLPGEGDLHTLRVECSYTATLPAGIGSLDVSNLVYEERIGWVEMVVTGGSAEGIPSSSPSKLLTEYPDTSPLAQRQATITLGEAGEVAAAALAKPDSNGVTARLATGLASDGSAGGLVALVAAVGLGVTHALAPGHGKTLMAAYLVGRRGRPRQAVGLGLAVAVSHTVGVGVLGLVTAVASSTFQPDRVYPWLTTGSALIVTGLGVALLVKAIRGRAHHDHDHDHDHDHHAHSHHDEHEHHHHHHELPDLGWRSLAALGLAGGLVPSASAVVLLLGAVAIGRPWFGVLLVFGFGVGMSVALVAAGLVALRLSKAGLDRIQRRIALPRRLVPALAGLAVTSVGGFLLWDALRTLG
ncbi:MAG: nickel/cobalt transporter [Acidimicrobiia bacterium]